MTAAQSVFRGLGLRKGTSHRPRVYKVGINLCHPWLPTETWNPSRCSSATESGLKAYSKNHTVYVCVYIYTIHTCIQACSYICIYICIHTYTCMNIYIYMYRDICACMALAVVLAPDPLELWEKPKLGCPAISLITSNSLTRVSPNSSVCGQTQGHPIQHPWTGASIYTFWIQIHMHSYTCISSYTHTYISTCITYKTLDVPIHIHAHITHRCFYPHLHLQLPLHLSMLFYFIPAHTHE